ncbi:hypothetical protein [Streptomyces sp. NPDC057052]|uniref:hypothetical protein n=1 Tax=Streptomyces sp. NPDC057052 TaxID=3346010 RepID=UPI003644D896
MTRSCQYDHITPGRLARKQYVPAAPATNSLSPGNGLLRTEVLVSVGLPILRRMPTGRVSELMGLAPALVRSSQHHAEHFLKSKLYPTETEGTTP